MEAIFARLDSNSPEKVAAWNLVCCVDKTMETFINWRSPKENECPLPAGGMMRLLPVGSGMDEEGQPCS